MKKFIQFTHNFIKSKKQLINEIASASQYEVLLSILNLVLGFLIINSFTAETYATYVLAFTFISLINNTSTNSLNTSLMALSKTIWSDQQVFSTYFMSARWLKNKLSLIVMAVILPIIIWTLLSNDFTPSNITLFLAVITPSIISDFISALQNVPLQLDNKISFIQKTNLVFTLGKIILVGIILLTTKNIYSILLIIGVLQLLRNLYVQKHIKKHYPYFKSKPSKEAVAAIKKRMFKLLPQSIFSALNGQLTILLMSFYGTPTLIGQAGALGKLSKVFKIFTNVYSILILPKFSKKKFKSARHTLTTFFSIQASKMVVGALIIGVLLLFPDYILALLGDEYKTLSFELYLIMASMLVGFVQIGKFNTVRDYIPSPWIMIPLKTALISVIFFIVAPQSLDGFLFFKLYKSLMALLITNATFIYFNNLKHDRIS